MAARNKPVKTSADYSGDQGWKRAIEDRKRTIQCAIRGLAYQQDLDALGQVGADADKILLALAFAVPDRAKTKTLKEMLKARQRRLSALADRLESLSDDVRNVIADPLNSNFYWAVLAPSESEELIATEKLESFSNSSRKRIRPILDFLRGEARECGALHRYYDRIMSTKYMGGLLQYVKDSTGEFQDERVANLLQAAHEALGEDASFTAEKLRKLRQRRFPSLVRKRRIPTLYDRLPFLVRPLSELDNSGGEKSPLAVP